MEIQAGFGCDFHLFKFDVCHHLIPETTVSVYTLVIITIFQNSTKIKVKIEKKATDSATEIFLKIICILEQQNESEVMSN